jgi:arginine deiminase
MILSENNRAVVELANTLASTVEYDERRVKACFRYIRCQKHGADTEQERVAVAVESFTKNTHKYVVWKASSCDDTQEFEKYVEALNSALTYIKGLVLLGFTAEKAK